MPHALIVEDDPNSLSGLSAILDADGFSVDTAATLAEAKRALTRFIPDVVLIDLNLPDGKGLDLLPSLPVQPPDGTVPVIVMTGNATVESAIEGLRHGIWDYLLKPISIPRLRSLLARIPRPFELSEEVLSLKAMLRHLGRFGPMVGRSPLIQNIYDAIERLALGESPVLVVGEIGTGKETVARAIHHCSRRRKAPFVAFDCRQAESRPSSSLLFGQERSALPMSALSDGRATGAFERATGGTLFLDEITQLPLEQQRLLVEALENRTFRRVGGSHDIPTDFRLIVATSDDVQRAVAEGRLHEALYRLIDTYMVPMPPLRERLEDVELLAHYFVEQLNAREGTQKRLAPAAIRAFSDYEWPGNVQELRESIEIAYRHSDGVIDSLDVPENGSGSKRVIRPGTVEISVGMPLEEVEEMLIRATLDAVGGTRHRAASMLGISPKTLYNKLQKMKLA
ncbi:sigma-54 dependent transcriptional regulator [Robbsia sp. Bb-Pol-6]|uniref:Sigma-54 dependent transcriptional regulator n=1 Tax=Robbsia betulipollinis TaxID=2981849 RepID=A0ABT3ZPY8_9BURK|nr:sigma-54 dependent transcriptional regulator [Robbsia betulipollinis]MCY0388542.1 sigma-54 dependent transcriptional regulator [Robbsia betulipollinis]